MPANAKFGNRIAEARGIKGYTIKEAAHRMSVTEKTFKVGKRQEQARANKIQMLSGVLGVSLLWLLDGEEKFEPDANNPSQLEILGEKVERMTELHQELHALTDEVASEVEELYKIEEDLEILKD